MECGMAPGKAYRVVNKRTLPCVSNRNIEGNVIFGFLALSQKS